MEFGIHIKDESQLLSEFVTVSNEKSINLYDWQRRAMDYFFCHNKAVFEIPTGAGKTYCAIRILQKIHELEPNARCLVVVPKNVILETGWYKEFYNAGYGLMDIGVYYGPAKEYGKITITNMQSLKKIALELFDVAVFDECHNYGTKRLIPYLEHNFKYKVGLSATIERMDSMHWEILRCFEYNLFKYSPHQAIQEGVLNPFRFYNISVEMDANTEEEYNELTQKINTILVSGGGFNRVMKSKGGLKYRMLSLMTKRKQLVNNYNRKFDVVKIICKKNKGEKTLIFNQYNSQTSKLYWYLLEVGIKAKILHSGVKKEERDQILIDYQKGRFDVLLTTKVLDEGYNLPAIRCAVIMAGDSTPKQTIQRLGRVLRRKDKDSLLYQVFCKGTIEEEQAWNRANLFKELASGYNDYEYHLDSELVL